MTVFYVRPKTGNDAALGTSPATAWRSLTLGATAARIAPGDEIRIEESGAPVNVGNATWTAGSGSVALAAAMNLSIDPCDVAWVASGAGVTVATSVTRKLNAVSSSIKNNNRVLGTLAYRPLGAAVDASAYRQVCFWLRSDLVLPKDSLRLDLCSDAAGAVPVRSVTVPYGLGANTWTPLVVDAGVALPAAINSIALVALLDTGVATLLIDNIFAAKAPGAADELTLHSLVSTNLTNEPWFPIRSIDGAAVSLDAGMNDGPAALSPVYAGSAALVATWVKPTTLLSPAYTVTADGALVPWGLVNANGSRLQPILFSGGWDSATMTVQTSETILNAVTGFGVILSFNGKSHIHAQKIGAINARYGIVVTGLRAVLDDCCAYRGNGLPSLAVGAGGTTTVGPLIQRFRATGNDNLLVQCTGGFAFAVRFVDLMVSSCSHAANAAVQVGDNVLPTFDILRAYDAFRAVEVQATTLIRGGQNLKLRAMQDFALVRYGADVSITVVDFQPWCIFEVDAPSWMVGERNYRINLHNRNGVANDHLIAFEGGTITPDLLFFHSGDKSWLVAPVAGATRTTDWPIIFKLGPLWKLKSPPAAAQTVSVWVYRDNANIQARLRVPAGQLCTPTGDLTALDLGAVGVWNQIVIPITMSMDGAIDAQVEVYTLNAVGGYRCWIDDLA